MLNRMLSVIVSFGQLFLNLISGIEAVDARSFNFVENGVLLEFFLGKEAPDKAFDHEPQPKHIQDLKGTQKQYQERSHLTSTIHKS